MVLLTSEDRSGTCPLDISMTYRKQVRRLEVQEYEAMRAVAGFSIRGQKSGPRIPRLLPAKQLHRNTVDQLQREHGINDPIAKMPDMLMLVKKFVPACNPTILATHVSTSQYTWEYEACISATEVQNTEFPSVLHRLTNNADQTKASAFNHIQGKISLW